jgi:formate C-acetyltransferase
MVLEAQEHTRCWGTLGTVRVHKDTPDDFFLRALEVLRFGGGVPQLLNDEVTVPSMMSIGCELADARNYVPHGCNELAPDGNFAPSSWPRSYTGHFNLLKCVELALHNGVNPLSGEPVGPVTGDPANFESFDQLMDAVGKQIEYYTHQVGVIANIYDQVHAEHYPIPFTGVMNNVIGKDLNAGGAHYNWTGNYVAAQANAGDSLTAIKKLVFDDKEVTLSELVEALDANWDGYAGFRRKCVEAPKFGNDDEYADSVLRRVVFQYYDGMERNLCARGGRRFRPGCVTVTAYIPLGLMTAASADGRKSGEKVSDSVAPASGCDVNGPTQAMKSVTKMEHVRMPNGVIYNMKFHPGLIEDERGLHRWMDLIRTYFILGGMQVQVNVVSRETLLDAQQYPEKHQDLVVRVAGYSARFVDLGKSVQDSIIDRTEYNV